MLFFVFTAQCIVDAAKIKLPFLVSIQYVDEKEKEKFLTVTDLGGTLGRIPQNQLFNIEA